MSRREESNALPPESVLCLSAKRGDQRVGNQGKLPGKVGAHAGTLDGPWNPTTFDLGRAKDQVGAPCPAELLVER